MWAEGYGKMTILVTLWETKMVRSVLGVVRTEN